MSQFSVETLGLFTACEARAIESIVGNRLTVIDVLGFGGLEPSLIGPLARAGVAVLKARGLVAFAGDHVELSPIAGRLASALLCRAGVAVGAETEAASFALFVCNTNPITVLEPTDSDMFSLSLSNVDSISETAVGLAQALGEAHPVKRTFFASLLAVDEVVVAEAGRLERVGADGRPTAISEQDLVGELERLGTRRLEGGSGGQPSGSVDSGTPI